ncbi:MAG: hypothetical protein ACKER6_00605 [Candidatus Hodgkinia cicadicola]
MRLTLTKRNMARPAPIVGRASLLTRRNDVCKMQSVVCDMQTALVDSSLPLVAKDKLISILDYTRSLRLSLGQRGQCRWAL